MRDTIARDIVRGLYDGRYEPGQRLQEAQLTATYAVSRGPVREALNILATGGIVELTPQRGAQVRVLRVEEAIDTLIVAQTLIGLSARLAALRTDDITGRDRLTRAVAALEAFPSDADGAKFALARDAFYGAITALAANSELSRLLPTVRIHLIRVQFRAVLRAGDSGRRQDYSRLATAILAARPSEAETAAKSHLARSIARLQQFTAGKPSS